MSDQDGREGVRGGDVGDGLVDERLGSGVERGSGSAKRNPMGSVLTTRQGKDSLVSYKNPRLLEKRARNREALALAS